MDDLFVHTLRDVYYAENKIVQSLPEMIENATDKQLKTDLESHLDETKRHVQRLEQVFQMLGTKTTSLDCPAIDGIIAEKAVDKKPTRIAESKRNLKAA
jgi:ferritin-like metal-binding protein YciE